MSGPLSYKTGLLVAIIALAALLGLSVAVAPPILASLLTLVGIATVIGHAGARLGLVVIGALLVFQRTDHVDLPKILYFALTTVAIAASLPGATPVLFRSASRSIQFLSIASTTVFAYLGFHVLLGLSRGTPLPLIVRDVAPYALVCVVPLLAMDSARLASSRFIVGILVVSGSMAALGFASRLLYLRELSPIALDRSVLPSFFLPSALAIYACSRAVTSAQTRIGWLVLAASVPALLVISGTRSTLLLIVALPFTVALARIHQRIRPSRLIISFAALGLLFIVIGAMAVRLFDVDAEALQRRLGESILKTATDPYSDASFSLRMMQTRDALAVFSENPVVGSGPGSVIRFGIVSNTGLGGLSADSPAVLLAKYGVVGVLLFLVLTVGYFAVVTAGRARSVGVTATAALGGYMTLFVAYSLLLGPAMEDKGFFLGLWMLLALALKRSSHLPTPADGSLATSIKSDGEIQASELTSATEGLSRGVIRAEAPKALERSDAWTPSCSTVLVRQRRGARFVNHGLRARRTRFGENLPRDPSDGSFEVCAPCAAQAVGVFRR